MLAMLRLWMLIALVMLSACEAVAGGWDLVQPSIRFQGDVFDSPDGYPELHFTEEVRITYIGDSLAWTAEELAHRMTAMGLSASIHEINNLFDTTLCNSDSASQEILLTLSNPDLELLFSSDEDFFLRFGLVGIPDEYTIWTRDCACVEGILENSCLISIIAATDQRGLLYGVTSFAEAIHEDVAEQWIKPMMIRDYPSFPRRIIGDKYDLGDSAQFAGPTDHGFGLLSAARDLLLKNKGNGLIQFGAVNGLNLNNVETVFETMHDGDVGQDCWSSEEMGHILS